MLCEKCNKNNATIFYEENINGKKRRMALCSHCADELKQNGELWAGETMFDDFGFPSPLSLHNNIFGSLFEIPQSITPTEEKCKGCSSTFNDFKKRGKAGCPLCYSTFAKQLDTSIRSIHGNAKHNGRSPKRFAAKHERENILKSLRNKLKDAISQENFEKAAELRDKIKEIENKSCENS